MGTRQRIRIMQRRDDIPPRQNYRSEVTAAVLVLRPVCNIERAKMFVAWIPLSKVWSNVISTAW